jgi:dynein heavy chain, axonemal
LPEGYEEKLDVFEKLLLVKVFRPEKVMVGVVNYVLHYLGKFFMEPPQVTMDGLYADSDVATPIIFVLS